MDLGPVPDATIAVELIALAGPPSAQREQQRAARATGLQRRRDIFVADELEDAIGGSWMPTRDPWAMWQKRCAARGKDPGGQRSLTQRLAKNFTHDPKHGRPRLLNVRAKTGKHALRVVASN